MKIFFTITLSQLAALAALASPVQPAEETFSRALQQAKRVAAMENDQDLPSRAVWLGQRAAKNSRLSFESKPRPKASRSKKSSSSQN
ncbi:MAG TPA: hypothetical protein VIH99_08910 [Bdellovibrionota bacterium]